LTANTALPSDVKTEETAKSGEAMLMMGKTVKGSGSHILMDPEKQYIPTRSYVPGLTSAQVKYL